MKKMTISKEILKRGYVRRLLPAEEGGYVASIQEFPGLVAEGDTAEEALANLEKAALSWLDVSLANGREIREPISFDSFSGKIALRIPRGLHQQVAALAECEECSVNQLLTTAIATYVGNLQVSSKVSRIVRQVKPKLIDDTIYSPMVAIKKPTAKKIISK
jgi:predicted RNase H-like HicB family nuclease